MRDYNPVVVTVGVATSTHDCDVQQNPLLPVEVGAVVRRNVPVRVARKVCPAAVVAAARTVPSAAVVCVWIALRHSVTSLTPSCVASLDYWQSRVWEAVYFWEVAVHSWSDLRRAQQQHEEAWLWEERWPPSLLPPLEVAVEEEAVAL